MSTPSNEITRLAAEFTAIIGISDERYSFELYGPRFFKSLPQRFGSHPALDDMTSAVVASFQSVRLRQQFSPRALSLYGKALRSLQACLNDPKQPVTFKLELVVMVMLCQVCCQAYRLHLANRILSYGLITRQRTSIVE
jgi:hypothetical protein